MPIHVTTSTTQSLSNKTFVDHLSTTGAVYTANGNSDQWSSTYTTFSTQSANNTTVYSVVNSNSASWASGGGSSNIWIPAAAWIPRTTLGCGVDSRELSANRINVDETLFDAATAEYAQALVVMPNNYNNGTITSRFYWTASVSAFGDVIWGLQGRAYSDGDPLDAGFGTAQTVTDSFVAINNMHVTNATSSITLTGTPAANRPVILQVYRDAAAGGDTFANDARLLGVEILYTSA